LSSKLKTKFPLDELARRIEAIRTTNPDGRVAFDGPRFTDLEMVFRTAIDWDESLSDYERDRIAFNAPFVAARAGQVTKDALLKAVHELEAKEFAAKPTDYVVVTTLTVRYHAQLKKVRVRNVQFSFFQKLPKKYDRDPIRNPFFLGDMVDVPDDFVVVCAKVSAKSVHAAAAEALTALSVLRGIWNYTINRRTTMTLPVGGVRQTKPINKILLGPVHTVHFPQGALAEKAYWHNGSFEPEAPENLAEEWAMIQKSTSRCLRWYHVSAYKKEITDMWVRYAFALDHADREVTFLKLWSLLELLTGTNGEKYDETIRRTLFMCDDRELHRMILEHLRDRRNAMIHLDDSSSKVEQHIYQLKRYVEELLRLHLLFGRLKKRFPSLNAVGEFLALPPEPTILKERQRIYRQAFDFRQKTLAAN
jgi:hypothetical protein